MATFDLVIVDVRGRSVSVRWPRIVSRESSMASSICSRARPGSFGGDDVTVGGFVDVDWRGPAVGVMRGQALEPFLPGRADHATDSQA